MLPLYSSCHAYTSTYIGDPIRHSVQFSCSVMSDSLWPHELQHARPPCPLPTSRVHSNSCPLSRWCHPAISSSVVPFSSCPQSLPASESFLMSQLFVCGGQSTGVGCHCLLHIQGYLFLIKPVSRGSKRTLSKVSILKEGGEGDDRGWDGWIASLTQWTQVWVNSGIWWWTGRPGVLQSMGSQRVGHNWVTELNHNFRT